MKTDGFTLHFADEASVIEAKSSEFKTSLWEEKNVCMLIAMLYCSSSNFRT